MRAHLSNRQTVHTLALPTAGRRSKKEKKREITVGTLKSRSLLTTLCSDTGHALPEQEEVTHSFAEVSNAPDLEGSCGLG